jgi:hypothetical protein
MKYSVPISARYARLKERFLDERVDGRCFHRHASYSSVLEWGCAISSILQALGMEKGCVFVQKFRCCVKI